jgi:hypothetical protein
LIDGTPVPNAPPLSPLVSDPSLPPEERAFDLFQDHENDHGLFINRETSTSRIIHWHETCEAWLWTTKLKTATVVVVVSPHAASLWRFEPEPDQYCSTLLEKYGNVRKK